eukprot:jgi/Tetstr1/430815/TSEL_020598.t1
MCGHFRGGRMLPYMDDFLFFASKRILNSGRAQFMFLAIKPARFYLRELHDVLRTKDSWSGRVKMTHHLRRYHGDCEAIALQFRLA